VVVGTGDGLTVVVAGVGVVACVPGVVVECVLGVVSECVPVEALEVAVPDADDDEDPDGGGIDGAVDDGEPVQAETAVATRTIKAAQLRPASRALLAGLTEVMRTLMEPP
jgi:hypothetical protein